MARVIIPSNPDELLTLIDKAITHETGLAADAFLKPAEIAELKGYYDIANPANTKQKELHQQGEKQTEIRDRALGKTAGAKVNQQGHALFLVTKLRDMALAANKGTPKALVDWGFEVDDSPQAKTPPAPPAQ